MPRPGRSRLVPWIESLIQSHGGEEEGDSTGQLKAHVTAVGQMTQSQAQTSEGPSGLLYLSDGVVQIPAILTADAWEHIQDREERECFSSLLNTTVCVRVYQLHFHMAAEQTRCRFFLSVGDLAATAAGPVKDNAPCCTTLPSVRMKIYKTWRALLGHEGQESQRSQYGFDLTELLGEWQHECLQMVLDDVRERLLMGKSRPLTQQPSTSACIAPPSVPNSATSWDVERVRHKGAGSFTVPVKHLLMPEDVSCGQEVPTGEEPAASVEANHHKPSETSQPPDDDDDDDVACQTAEPAHEEKERPPTQEASPLPDEDSLTVDGGNPWDMFPPPCDSSVSSDADQETPLLPSRPAPTTCTAERPLVLTSSSKESELSSIPPYQRLCPSTGPPPTSVSPSHSADKQNTPAVPSADRERQVLNSDEMKRGKAKRKRQREPTPEELSTLTEEDAQTSGSPPSWLFESQTSSVAEERSSRQLGETSPCGKRETPAVHGDGRPFAYVYDMSGETLQDFSRFRVSDSLLHWAVKYLLLPKRTGDPLNACDL